MQEVISGRVPYHGKGDVVVVSLVVVAKKKPERPKREISTKSDDGNALWEFLQRCWSDDARARPAVTDIGNMVRALFESAIALKDFISD